MKQNDFSVSGPENLAWAKKWLMPDIIIHLKKKVKFDELNEAVGEALKLHPLYQTALVQNERGEPGRINNTKLPIIKKFNKSEHILYGTPKYNNFSWLIRYSGKKIIVSISHMLSDGTGALNFIKTVLQYYFEKTGELPLNIAQEEIKSAYQTTENSYAKYGKGKKLSPQKEENCSASRLSQKLFLKDKENLPTYRFMIEKRKIKDLSIKFNVRPFTIPAALFSKALAITTGLKEGIILLPIPTNCRNYFPSKTDRNFIYGSLLKYDIKKMENADLKSVAQEFNQQFQKEATKEKMLNFFHEISGLTEIFKQSMEMAWSFRKNANKNNNNRTTTICYTHITHPNFPKEFEGVIENIEVAALPPRDSSVVYLFGFNFKDKITFSVKHIFKKNAYIKNLIALLNKEKIDFTLSRPRHKCLAKFFTVK